MHSRLLGFTEPTEAGTRIALRHAGLTREAQCRNTAVGWETSLCRLADMLLEERLAPA